MSGEGARARLAIIGRRIIQRYGTWLFAAFALAWSIDTSWEVHHQVPIEHWHSDLRADAAGYYVYLPGFFDHGMRATGWRSDIADITSNGFKLDREHDRVITKYSYGTALLQLPFYLTARTLPGSRGSDGYSFWHHRVMEMGACIYWVLAILLLYFALERLWPAPVWARWATLLMIGFGSNVIYYTLRSPGYSHIYSFFCVSLAIWALCSGVLVEAGAWRRWIFHIACALIILIRPVDVIIVAGLYVWLFMERPVVLRSAGWWIAQLLIGAVIIFPQLLYWHFAFGSWVAYSYGNEGFDNWRSPELSKFLFAPENGWISHAPVLFLLPFGVWFMWRGHRRLVLLLIGMLAMAVYACASWHVWHFGCSYGARPMVEYMPVVALVVFAFFARTDPASVRLRWAVLPLLTILVYLNYRAAMQYDICYADTGNWNWDPYLRNLLDAFSSGHWEHHP